MLTSASTPITPHPIPPLLFTIPRYIFLICKVHLRLEKRSTVYLHLNPSDCQLLPRALLVYLDFLPLSLLAGDFWVWWPACGQILAWVHVVCFSGKYWLHMAKQIEWGWSISLSSFFYRRMKILWVKWRFYDPDCISALQAGVGSDANTGIITAYLFIAVFITYIFVISGIENARLFMQQ
jgi:hypothetical protein